MAPAFTYGSWSVDPDEGRLVCTYALGDESFIEEVRLGPGGDWAAPGAAEAARLVFLLAGVSAYKTAAPGVIDLGAHPSTPAERAFLRTYYLEGLGEFAHRNGLDLAGLEVTGPDGPAPGAPAAPRPPGRPLVPFGGGIDSIVVAEAVRARHPGTTLFVVHRGGDRFAAIEDAAAVSGLAVRRAERTIDPKLLEPGRGYLNGHVPVTAVLSSIALLAAAVFGHDAVVMSNERSASAPTLVEGARAVNHQWSKSFAFEALLRDELAARALGVDYFSLLRPYSELWVARRFAALPAYHPAFCSCNRAFTLDPARRAARWCGRCDKCCFIDLVLAPFLDAAALGAVFEGAEPLGDPALTERFEALCGLGGTKPFECVGDEAECRAAARAAAARPERQGSPVLSALVGALGAGGPEVLGDLLAPAGPHFVPDAYAPDAALV